MQWYYSKNGSQLGPVDYWELQRLARSGELTRDEFVWNESMGELWKPVSSIEGLFDSAREVPPTLELRDGNTVNRDLMRMARTSLKGRWAMAVLVMLIYIVILEAPQIGRIATSPNPQLHDLMLRLHHTPIPVHPTAAHPITPQAVKIGSSIISIVFSVLTVFLTGPLLIGLSFFFLNLAKGVETKLADLFIAFHGGVGYYWKTVGTNLLLGLIVIGWTLLLLALPLGIGFGISAAIHLPSNSWVRPVLLIVGLLGIVTLISIFYSYAMVFFVLADQPSTKATECIGKSIRMMKGKKWKFFMLQLRFLGWMLLALMSCGIGLLWVSAYSLTAKAHFYLDVKDRA